MLQDIKGATPATAYHALMRHEKSIGTQIVEGGHPLLKENHQKEPLNDFSEPQRFI